MTDDMLIARNPEEGTSLPYLLRLPLGTDGIVLKARETWPRTSKVYCHRVDEWPSDAEILERLPVRSISKRGAAIDLVLDRGRESRSQFVLTRARGREMVFWQSRRTAKQARPNVSIPKARAHGHILDIVVDTREQYAYKFTDQQASTSRRALAVGDYAVFDGDLLVAAAERKSVEDLSASLISGKLTYLLAELATLPRAALVVDSGYSRLFKLEHVSAATVTEAVGEAQARFPNVPIVFCETRPLAQEWLYRWLGACLHEHQLHTAAPGFDVDRVDPTTAATLTPEPPPAPRHPARATPAEIRQWARAQGLDVSDKGRIPAGIVVQYEQRCGQS